MPGRPQELQFKGSVSRGHFPGAHRVEDERDRGRLLHFFANHELLATELMALVLLRFPAAPAAGARMIVRVQRRGRTKRLARTVPGAASREDPLKSRR